MQFNIAILVGKLYSCPLPWCHCSSCPSPASPPDDRTLSINKSYQNYRLVCRGNSPCSLISWELARTQTDAGFGTFLMVLSSGGGKNAFHETVNKALICARTVRSGFVMFRQLCQIDSIWPWKSLRAPPEHLAPSLTIFTFISYRIVTIRGLVRKRERLWNDNIRLSSPVLSELVVAEQ